MIEEARADWLALLGEAKPGQRLLKAGVLHCYFGVDDQARPVFFVVSDLKSDAPKLAELVHVDHGRRPDGKWTVVLTLADIDYTEAFIGMCLEVSRRASTASTEPAALQIFDATINQWRRLLSLKGARRLSEAEIRGLAAELRFLLDMSELTAPRVALEAWVGPHGAPQDFRFAQGRVYEVKAVRTGATSVHISSVEQLEGGEDDELDLVTVLVNDVPTGIGAATLVSLINEIRNSLDNDLSRIELLDEKLALLQFDVSDEYYSTRCFEFGPTRRFSVVDSFPRLRAVLVPMGVERVKYRLRLAAIEQFEVEPLPTVIEDAS